MAHIEVIDDREKLKPPLRQDGLFGAGVTGYRPPQTKASTREELLADLARTDGGRADLGYTVWKVKRTSVDWHDAIKCHERRVHFEHNRIPCVIIGSEREWWFVAVDMRRARRLLTSTRVAR